jgi:hypothetical protein
MTPWVPVPIDSHPLPPSDDVKPGHDGAGGDDDEADDDDAIAAAAARFGNGA